MNFKSIARWFSRTFWSNNSQKKHIVSLLRLLSVAVSGIFIAPDLTDKGDLNLSTIFVVLIFVLVIEAFSLFMLSLLEDDKDGKE